MGNPLIMRVKKPGEWSYYDGTDDTYHYYGGIVDKRWKINRMAIDDPLMITSATQTNNVSVNNLLDAWNNHASLTYS